MYLHARVYRVLDLIEVDLRTEPSGDEAKRGEYPTYRTFAGQVPAELEGQGELVLLLEALRAAARSTISDIAERARYADPPTER